jgi:hypothetical protein
MGTQPGAGRHPAEVERRRRVAANDAPVISPDRFWSEFAGKVDSARIKRIDIRTFHRDERLMLVWILRDGTIREHCALQSNILFWEDLIERYAESIPGLLGGKVA